MSVRDLDYFNAAIEEFHEALWPLDDAIERHDIADPLFKVLGQPLPTTATLAALDERDIERLRDEFRAWLEVDGVQSEHIRKALQRILARWSV